MSSTFVVWTTLGGLSYEMSVLGPRKCLTEILWPHVATLFHYAEKQLLELPSRVISMYQDTEIESVTTAEQISFSVLFPVAVCQEASLWNSVITRTTYTHILIRVEFLLGENIVQDHSLLFLKLLTELFFRPRFSFPVCAIVQAASVGTILKHFVEGGYEGEWCITVLCF